MQVTRFSSTPDGYMRDVRNIGISAHIDSGKTTLTERILYYTGKIGEIHDVRGKDGVGAKMDSMDLEREKGITIQSAATYCHWGDKNINIIDTPGHVDFTIEVERALRVLDGAILVLCGVSGVQSQTLTVDRQMKRYAVPRVAFVNKLDRSGANPWKALQGVRKELRLAVAPLQIPIGLENDFEGVVDIITREATRFEGVNGVKVVRYPCPEHLVGEMEEKRTELIEILAELDETIGELFLNDEEPSIDQIHDAVRRQTINLNFVPMFMGSAYKNKAVQLLLDGVVRYLPCPAEVDSVGLDLDNKEAPVALKCAPEGPLVMLAFKLQESRYGQLTYLRIYQGKFTKGQTIFNMKTGKKVRVPRIVRMHSNDMIDVESAGAGDVVAVFGVECASMDTFTDGTVNIAMNSMFIPKPVMSLACKTKESSMNANFSKAMGRFTREDPTLRIAVDDKTKETVLSGMGELHLDIYIERLRREYNVDVITGAPAVSYKETITQRAEFNYLHKKQSGGSGQYARVMGYIVPLTDEEIEDGMESDFENACIGNNIPPEFMISCEKGAKKSFARGGLAGFPMTGVRVVLTDGAAHAVDSNDMAFQLAMQYGIREAMKESRSQILEPMMNCEVMSPADFQGTIVAGINKRGGMVLNSDMSDDGSQVNIGAEVPLAVMFGYSTDLRSSTQGKAEFSMEYKQHSPVQRDVQENLIKKFLEGIKDE